MFVKTSYSTYKDKKYYTHELVKGVWNSDKQQAEHKTIANLSDLSEEEIQELKTALSDDTVPVDKDHISVDSGDSLRGAGLLGLWRGWEEANMDQVLEEFSPKQIQSIKAMVFSRIINPCSKRALSGQMADTFLAKRFSDNRLHQDTLYEVMDQLADSFRTIQKNLRNQHGSEAPRLMLYDTTSTYFEGTCADEGAYGHSKDKRWDRHQIIIGVVTDQDGLPLAVEVWSGNTHDVDTINDQIQMLQEEFGFEEVTFVGDSGMYGKEQIQTLQEEGFDYIIGMAWRAQKKRLTELSPRQRRLFDQKGYYQWKEGSTRYVGCHSEAKKLRALRRRKQAMKRVRDQLNHLQETARNGAYYTKLRLHEKIAELLKEEGVRDLFTITIDPIEEEADEEVKCPQKLTWDLDRIALRKRKALEGKYILQTSIPEDEGTNKKIEQDYKQLQHIERGFRHIKSYLKVRPIYHRLKRRVRAHVLICFLSYFLVKFLEADLREAGETREVETVINRWDQLRMVKNEVNLDGYDIEDWKFSRGERGEQIIKQIKEVGWWKSIQAYGNSITKQILKKTN